MTNGWQVGQASCQGHVAGNESCWRGDLQLAGVIAAGQTKLGSLLTSACEVDEVSRFRRDFGYLDKP